MIKGFIVLRDSGRECQYIPDARPCADNTLDQAFEESRKDTDSGVVAFFLFLSDCLRHFKEACCDIGDTACQFIAGRLRHSGRGQAQDQSADRNKFHCISHASSFCCPSLGIRGKLRRGEVLG